MVDTIHVLNRRFHLSMSRMTASRNYPRDYNEVIPGSYWWRNLGRNSWDIPEGSRESQDKTQEEPWWNPWWKFGNCPWKNSRKIPAETPNGISEEAPGRNPERITEEILEESPGRINGKIWKEFLKESQVQFWKKYLKESRKKSLSV